MARGHFTPPADRRRHLREGCSGLVVGQRAPPTIGSAVTEGTEQRGTDAGLLRAASQGKLRVQRVGTRRRQVLGA
ncbi:MAG: hypothetical protein ACRDS0_17815 [Pseudonocardiaceae bacterium]